MLWTRKWGHFRGKWNLLRNQLASKWIVRSGCSRLPWAPQEEELEGVAAMSWKQRLLLKRLTWMLAWKDWLWQEFSRQHGETSPIAPIRSLKQLLHGLTGIKNHFSTLDWSLARAPSKFFPHFNKSFLWALYHMDRREKKWEQEMLGNFLPGVRG